MTEENTSEISSQSENKNNLAEEQETSAHYGTPLVVINTLIILCLVILGLSYKKDLAEKELEKQEIVHEVIQNHDDEQEEKQEQEQEDVVINDEETKEENEWVTPHISRQAKIHILYGDETGGAHYHTVTTPCKSLFPKDWNPEKIIAVTEKIAANDNLEWKPRKNGNMYTKDIEDGIWVGVIMDPSREFVITSFPLNASRNPCPKETVEPQAKESEEEIEKDDSFLDGIEIEHRYDHNN